MADAAAPRFDPDSFAVIVRRLEAVEPEAPPLLAYTTPVATARVEAWMNRLWSLLFPREHPEPGTLPHTESRIELLGQVAWELAHFIHHCLSHACRDNKQPCPSLKKGLDIALAFADELPDLAATLRGDAEAAYDGDPAAQSVREIITTYPGFRAVVTYRWAHHLHRYGVPLLPRIMTEIAHSRTGIDIHPGAHIGAHFFIDHGTGVVIGETTVIGERVTLYQGVTLGAHNFPRGENGEIVRGQKRHPTLEDDVVVYSGATILGGATVIGKGSVIGGNVWLTESVPPGSRVIARPQVELKAAPR